MTAQTEVKRGYNMEYQQKIWDKYKKCADYQEQYGLIDRTRRHWNFYLGHQWENLQTGGETMPQYNLIMPSVKYKVNTICQQNISVKYFDLNNREENNAICNKLNEHFLSMWERSYMDAKIREICKSAAVAADSYIYFGTKDMTDAQVLPNTMLLLGDEQNPNIQDQPHIFIRERVRVKDLKEIAKRNGVEDWEHITYDEDSDDYMVGNKEDVDNRDDEGKATVVRYMTKIGGIVYTSRQTKNVMIEPLMPIAVTQGGKIVRGLQYYPIASYIWEAVPNSARGEGEVEQLIPNQICINKTLAMIYISNKQCAYPKLAVNTTMLQNPEDLNKVGGILELTGNAQSVQQMASYLPPQAASSDAMVFVNNALETTRSLAGASDSALGQIDPTRVSGQAIQAIKDQAATNLNENMASLKKFVEDCAKIVLDILKTYSPEGIEVSWQDENGERQTDVITAEQLDALTPDIAIDVEPRSDSTPEARQNVIDGLLNTQMISLEEWVEVSPDNAVIPKARFREMLEKRKEKQAEQLRQQLLTYGVPQEELENMSLEQLQSMLNELMRFEQQQGTGAEEGVNNDNIAALEEQIAAERSGNGMS